MPRYHFHLHVAEGPLADEEGQLFDGVEAAREEAIRGARSLVAEDVLNGRLDLEGRVEVADEDGRLLFAVSFAEAVGAAASR